MSKRILMVLNKFYPPDIRVEKEVRTLTKAGYQVVLICHFDPNAEYPRCEERENLIIHRFDKKRDHRILYNLTQNFRQITFFSMVWSLELKKLFREYSFDYIHIHDLPLLKTVLKSKPSNLECPVILDLHENYPAFISSRSGVDKGKKIFKKWYNYEKKAVAQADNIIVVAEENKRYLIDRHGIPPDRVSVISNTLDIDEVNAIDFQGLSEYVGCFVVSYVGGFGGGFRGIHVLVQAVKHLVGKIPELKLVLVGASKNSYSTQIRKLVADLDLVSNVEMIDRVGFPAALSYIKASDIGVIPHSGSLLVETTLPHKLFQYMYFEKPVLVSDCAPLKRIVEEVECGKVFKEGNSQDCATKIEEFYHEDLYSYGIKGYQGVMNKYNWHEDSKVLIRLYQECK